MRFWGEIAHKGLSKTLLEKTQSWLQSIVLKHHTFTFDKIAVEHILYQVLVNNKEQLQIFPGVFATPVGDTSSDDVKLVPLKLVKVTPGAIIPLHSHGGFEYYQLLMGSELIDTRGCYNEDCACMCRTNEIHAVTNISSTDSYALIALPTVVNLHFLNQQEARRSLAISCANINPDEKYKAHNLFLQLLNIENLIQSDQMEYAERILETLDINKITSTIQIKYMETLAYQLSEAQAQIDRYPAYHRS